MNDQLSKRFSSASPIASMYLSCGTSVYSTVFFFLNGTLYFLLSTSCQSIFAKNG